MANASDTKAGDGLVIPDKVPGDDLKPDNIRAAADALDTVATSYNTTADDVDTAWAAIPASFVAPGAEIVYAGMSKPTQSARTFATKVGTVTGALRTYADSLAAVKKTLKAIKADAETFLTEFDANHRVWMNARDTQEYEWDSNLGAGTAATARGMGAGGEDPIAYLRGRGETARSKGGTAQIRVHWSQSGDHVARNNALMDRIADAYAKVNALEVECANTINGQRDDCVAELTPVEAWQLKQGGENTVDLPWGHRTDEQRNCGESFGNGIVSSAVGAIQGLGGLIGYNPIKNQFWDGEHALQAWGGTLTAVGSLLIVSTNPLAPLLGSLGVPIYKEATDNTASMVKGLVAWDTWATNPAEAAGAVVFNIGTLFIPGVNVAKGLSILSKFEIVAGAITKVDKIVSKLDDLFPGGKPPHVDIDTPRLDTHLPDTHLPDGTGAPRVHIDEPDAPTVPHDVTPPVRDHDGPGATSGPQSDGTEGSRTPDDQGGGQSAGTPDGSPSDDHFVPGLGVEAEASLSGQLSIEPPRADLNIAWGNDHGYVDIDSVLGWKTPVPRQGWPDLSSMKFETAPDTQLFWTGRTEMPNPDGAPFVGSSDLATGLAHQRGAVTLETYLVEHEIKMPRWSADPAVQKVWGEISQQYAQSARGIVRVVLGRNIRPDAVWLTYEFDALKANPNVTQIIAIDPATGGMRTLFERE